MKKPKKVMLVFIARLHVWLMHRIRTCFVQINFALNLDPLPGRIF
mgnify:CR=1 FL=1